MARLNFRLGHADVAEKQLQQATALVPGYPYALSELAHIRLAQDKASDAVELLRTRLNLAPELSGLYYLASALDRAGRAGEAKAAYSDFESKALAAMEKPDNANRELTLYYTGAGNKPKEAVRIARHEIERRHDVYSLDAYAWALYRDGDYPAAKVQMDRALAPGIKNADFFYHAGAIAAKLNDSASASKYFKKSLEVNANSVYSPAVIQGLAEVGKGAS